MRLPLSDCSVAACLSLFISDVANLVLDGADGIVLGSETFRGKFPVLAAETVLAICRQAEFSFDSFGYYYSVMDYMGNYKINPNIGQV